MRNQFLCPQHRQWLASHPHAATAAMTDAQETGYYYRDRGRYQDALPYLGCAYETAEIVLSTQVQDSKMALIGFTSSAILLADNYTHLGMQKEGKDICKWAQNRLQAEYALHLHEPLVNRCVIDCIKVLNNMGEWRNWVDADTVPALTH